MFNTVKEVLADVLTKGSKRLLATYLQTLLAYPDGCTRSETVFDPVKGDILVQVPPLAEQRAIVVLLDGVDGAIERDRAETSVIRSSKASVADAPLTGRVRVGELQE